MKNLRPWFVRWSAVPVVSVYLYRLMAQHRHLAACSPQRWMLKPMTHALGDAFPRKLQAMALYSSQFREFFTDALNCETLFKSYADQMEHQGIQVERYWKLMN
jgi:hypothetical protein